MRWQGLFCYWRSSTSATLGTSRSLWSVGTIEMISDRREPPRAAQQTQRSPHDARRDLQLVHRWLRYRRSQARGENTESSSNCSTRVSTHGRDSCSIHCQTAGVVQKSPGSSSDFKSVLGLTLPDRDNFPARRKSCQVLSIT